MTTRVVDILPALGTHAARPAATAVPAGGLYSCSDHNLIYRSDGATWSTWATLSGTGIAATLVDAKGDLIVATANDTVARQAVGSNGQVLTADSTVTNGLKWAAAASGGFGAWGAYTPVIKGQTTDPTMGSGSVLTGKYREDSETVEVEIYGKFGTGPTAGTGSYYYLSIPVAVTSDYHTGGAVVQAVGWGWQTKASTGNARNLIVKAFPDTTHVIGYLENATTIFGPTQPSAPLVGDEFGMILRYRK